MSGEVSTFRKIVFVFIIVIISGLSVLLIGEGMARLLEEDVVRTGNYFESPHPILGWIANPNSLGTQKTGEYTATYKVNHLGMNDVEPHPSDENRFRILVAGDSHTFALGVDMEQAWPNQLESVLNRDSKNDIVVYNGGVIGYGLGQYLNRIKILDAELNPDVIIAGFSMATDLYDLIPPERGGFVYGGNADRIYYDLTESGELVEKSTVATSSPNSSDKPTAPQKVPFSIRANLYKSALFRLLKRSKLAFWIAARFRPGGKPLWPGLDTALKIQLSDEDEYRWRLAEKLIERMSEYAQSKDKEFILVNIPYLAQVYDEIWESSFGGLPEKYDRDIASQRLKAICDRYKIRFIDTTMDFRNSAKETGRWLHYFHDGHPNPEGHQLIADVVIRDMTQSGLINTPN